MTRDDERRARANEQPIVGGLPELPGILVAMNLAPGLAIHLRGLADELLVKDFPGATITRGERELLATAVSAANDCFYCMDTHGAFACAIDTDLHDLLDGSSPAVCTACRRSSPRCSRSRARSRSTAAS